MRNVIFILALTIPVFAACTDLSRAEVSRENETKVGWLEQVRIQPSDMLLHAKLDTGADSCSVHAEDMKIVKQKKGTYVRFTMSNRYGERKRLKQKVVRWTKIKKEIRRDSKTSGGPTQPLY